MGGILSNFQSTCLCTGSEDFIDGVNGDNNLVSSTDCLLQKFVFVDEGKQMGANIDWGT